MRVLSGQKSGVMLAAISLLVMQSACYDTYVIDKDELRKLESSVEQREVVEVYGDCPAGSISAARLSELGGTLVAQAEGAGEEATDAEPDAVTEPAVAAAGEEVAAPGSGGERPECVVVPVSTANSLMIITNDDLEHRVTPFNFIMSDSQLVSPEYDLLLRLDNVTSAEVKRFSRWKTIATITGVVLVTGGTFAAIGLLAPPEQGFEN